MKLRIHKDISMRFRRIINILGWEVRSAADGDVIILPPMELEGDIRLGEVVDSIQRACWLAHDATPAAGRLHPG